jgi:hypothetical protein
MAKVFGWVLQQNPRTSSGEQGGKHYDPNQPRVSAGHSDGGQWTSGSGPAARYADDQSTLSDAAADDLWKLDAQYAQNRRGSRGGSLPPTPGQSARLAAAEARANAAVRQVRERDPTWRPRPSLYQTVEGQIAATEATAAEAEAYLVELARNGIGPGPFGTQSIRARGPGRDFTPVERAEINRIGYQYGCHTCGTRNPETPLGNFVCDHQPPTIVNTILQTQQRLFPQCVTCSLKQGLWLIHRGWRRQ